MTIIRRPGEEPPRRAHTTCACGKVFRVLTDPAPHPRLGIGATLACEYCDAIKDWPSQKPRKLLGP